MKIFKKGLAAFLLFYLRIFSKIQLKKIKPTIIGVGGSSGKSSTVLLLSLILSSRFRVKNSKGKNSESGIPLDILDIEIDYSFFSWIKAFFLAPLKILTNYKKYDIYISEMGIDSPFSPKNMSYLLKIIKPNLAVVTGISIEHSEYFDPLVKESEDKLRKEKLTKLIADEELMLPKSIGKKGFSVLNLDDIYIKTEYRSFSSNIITISRFDSTADFFIQNELTEIGKYELSFKFKNKIYRLELKRALPSHFSYLFLLTLATAHLMGVPLEEGIAILEQKFSLPPGRVSFFKGIKNSLIIDSSYNNATLEAVSDLLSFLSTIGKNRRKIAIIGDMREQGSITKIQHEELAKKIAETSDVAFLIGPAMENFVSPILQKNRFPYFSYKTFSEAKNKIKDFIKDRDIILVKGSQNTLFLERVVEILLKDKDDVKFLPRRGKFWDQKRKVTL